MPASPSQDRTTRRQQRREHRQVVFQPFVAGLEALQGAGVSAWIIQPLRDDRPVAFLVEATEMPRMSLAARILRRTLGDVMHHVVFSGDLTPEPLAALRSSAWDSEAVRQHQRDQAA